MAAPVPVTTVGPDYKPRPEEQAFEPYGAAIEALYYTGPELILSGPAGTGKSRLFYEKAHIVCKHVPGVRVLNVRKTRASLNQSGRVTYENKVLPVGTNVRFHHGDQAYKYKNGSLMALAGMDKPSKAMSTEWDLIFVQEATELSEHEWEMLTTRLRAGVLPYQQIMGDVNPDSPEHWIYKRWLRGQLHMLESRHQDNPTVTEAYLDKLRALTGVRRARLYEGKWVAAVGQVYENYDPFIHLINRIYVPKTWRRIWSIDFGFNNPFCWQCWVIDPDGNMILQYEIYHTKTMVETAAKKIMDFCTRTRQPMPEAVITDHDAQARATFEHHTGLGTTPAKKNIEEGVQLVQSMLSPNELGQPRIKFMRDTLIHAIDPDLEEAKLPVMTIAEFPSYVWDTKPGKPPKETPVDKDNHGMDPMRYAAMYLGAPSSLNVSPEARDLLEGVSLYV